MICDIKKRILIVGMGISGIGFGEYLKKNNFEVFFFDDKLQPNLETKVDYVYFSPGVHENYEIYTKIGKIGIPQINDFDYFYSKYNGTIIAVSGTAGKTSTCHLLKHLMPESGMCGNMGIDIFQEIDKPIVIIEISSKQLERTNYFAADYAILTNMEVDHGDSHINPESYISSKKKIFRINNKKQFFLTSKKLSEQFSKLNCNESIKLNENQINRLKEINLPLTYSHNLINVENAITIANQITELSIDHLIEKLYNFELPRFRQEKLEWKDKIIINDSKSTNVTSCIAAMENYNDFIWIAGGLLKNKYFDHDFTGILKYKNRIKYAFFFGKDRDVFYDFFKDHFPCIKIDLQDSVEEIQKHEIRTILFSPIGQSLDAFKSYIERGIFFNNLLKLT